MPGWHKATESLRKKYHYQTVGIIQEQHPDRCALFMQWKNLHFPIMVDSYNLLGVKVVPMTIAIDEFGIVRQINPKPATLEKDFLGKTFDKPTALRPTHDEPAPSYAGAQKAGTLAAWRRYGDSLVTSGHSPTEIMDAYERGLAINRAYAPGHFRIGVAYRKRFDSDARWKNDFNAAATHWSTALRLNPNQYIWRRRIQQYGPRLNKPYPFYNWVETARREITARGDTPKALRVEPKGAELALPASKFEPLTKSMENPDPRGEIERDDLPIILAESTVVPAAIKPGEVARVYVILSVDPRAHAHWNNESGPMEFWVDAPAGWETDTKFITFDVPNVEQSEETRTIEFELRSPNDARPGIVKVSTFALYFVCREADGVCLFRRKDVTVPVRIR